MITATYIVLSILITVCCMFYAGIQIKNYYYLNKYQTILNLFNYFLDMAYDIIYQNTLITYTAEGIRNIPKEILETIERDYIKLTISLMGERNTALFIQFFGNKECVISHIIYTLRNKITKDEISKLVEKRAIEGVS